MSNINKTQKATILIVDDQPVVIKTLSEILCNEYNILVSKNGEKAIEIATENKNCDLILLDIVMPEMDGFEVCRRLKSNEQTRHIPVIFLTSKDEAEEERKGFLIGGSDYIVKPFKPQIIRVRIRNQIQSKKYMDMLEELAHEDPLTGIANRRTYDEMTERIWKQCVREKLHISLIMLDIDHFKAFNDNYGHGAGDECLIKVAQSLNVSANRPLDIAARYGGEEFAIILHNTDINGTKAIAQKMILNIRELNIPHEYSPVAPIVTISAGCASIMASNRYTFKELEKNADKALYYAKKAGKNQCKTWEK